MLKNSIVMIIIFYLFQIFNLVYSHQDFYSFALTERENQIENEQIMIQKQIDNAIYVIRNKEGDKNLDLDNNKPTFLNNPKKSLKKHFRFISIDKNTNKPTDIISSDNYYCIEDKDYHKRIGIINQEGEIGLFDAPKDNSIGINDNCLWKIYPKIILENYNDVISKRVYYYLQNRGNGKYLSYVVINKDKGILSCNFENIEKLNDRNYFILNRMYREKNPKESSEILEKEPIDVLIKYIDLSDPNLNREKITQIKKDEDNGELRYVVRSILKNIPWIRKIFILMPNEKVKYFKDPEEIKDKIVYVKDKDVLGFDSASSPAFQFNLWKMKDFGLSENFILMDDDYFIGKPLKKSNFFYEEDGQVYPALVTGDYYELNKKNIEIALNPLLAKINSIGSHTPNGFTIMQKSSLLFLYNIFSNDDKRYGQPLIEAAFSHNAIPVKQSDIKEIYDYINLLYPYASETLKAKTRHIRSLQPQTLFLSYAKNQHDRVVKIITSKFYDLTQFKGKIESELYVINTSDKNYAKNYFVKEIQNLQKLYPEKSPYEKDDNLDNLVNPNNNNQNQNKNNKDNKQKKNALKEELEIILLKEKEKSKNEIYDKILEYLKSNLNEKGQFNKNILEIKEKIDYLNQKYDKIEKEIEEITKKYNNMIKSNVTVYEKQNENSPFYLFLEILFFIVILLCFILYLYSKGQFNVFANYINKGVNYSEINNSFGNIDNGIDLNLIESK